MYITSNVDQHWLDYFSCLCYYDFRCLKVTVSLKVIVFTVTYVCYIVIGYDNCFPWLFLGHTDDTRVIRTHTRTHARFPVLLDVHVDVMTSVTVRAEGTVRVHI